MSKLNIISVEKETSQKTIEKTYISIREQTQAKYDTLWLRTPDKFDPNQSCTEKQRIKNTLSLIKETISLKGSQVADIGCGIGTLTYSLRNLGAHVDAIDASKYLLKQLQQNDSHNIQFIHDVMPSTRLKDNAYDLIVCTELIAHLPERTHRLFFSELARLIKKEGIIVCSTPLDIFSEDALERFLSISKTELIHKSWIMSHHRYLILLLDLLKAPARFAKAGSNIHYRNEKLETKQALSRLWFKWNSKKIPSLFWKGISFLSTPLANTIKRNRHASFLLEKICRFFCPKKGVSHIIVLTRRKPVEAVAKSLTLRQQL